MDNDISLTPSSISPDCTPKNKHIIQKNKTSLSLSKPLSIIIFETKPLSLSLSL